VGSVTYNDTTIVAGNTYSYRVAALNQVSPSAFVNGAMVTVPPAPAAPLNFTAAGRVTGGGATARIDLRWTDNSNNETRFIIQRASDANFTTGLATYTLAANVTSFAQTNLAHGLTYYYRIQARNLYGGSVWVNATPFPITTP
jgi:titin